MCAITEKHVRLELPSITSRRSPFGAPPQHKMPETPRQCLRSRCRRADSPSRRNKPRQPQSSHIKRCRRPTSQPFVLLADQAVGKIGNAIPPNKKRRLDCWFILKLNIGRIKQPGDGGDDQRLALRPYSFENDDIAGRSHLPVIGRAARVHRSAARVQRGTELVSQQREHLVEPVAAAHRAAAADDYPEHCLGTHEQCGNPRNRHPEGSRRTSFMFQFPCVIEIK